MNHNDVSDAEAERGATIEKRLQGIHPDTTAKPDLRTFEELLRSGMPPMEIWQTIKDRPPATDNGVAKIDLKDLFVCAGSMGAALVKIKDSQDTELLLPGAICFGLYVGIICERLSNTPRFKAMVEARQ